MEEFLQIYEKYVNTVYRIALMMLKNTADAEDVTQNVFIKLMNSGEKFDGDEHLKAWLITVTRNICRNMMKSWWHSKRGGMEQINEQAAIPQNADRDIWDKVMGLDEKYKLPVYLYYYEGYDTGEISRMLKVNHATLRTRLRTARKKLRLILEAGRAEKSTALLAHATGADCAEKSTALLAHATGADCAEESTALLAHATEEERDETGRNKYFFR